MKTPDRASKAFQFLTHGYSKNLEEVVNGAVFDASSSNLVVIKDVWYYI